MIPFVLKDISDAGFTHEFDPVHKIIRIIDKTKNTQERVQWTVNSDTAEVDICRFAMYIDPEAYAAGWVARHEENAINPPTAEEVFEDGLILQEKWSILEDLVLNRIKDNTVNENLYVKPL